MACVHLGEQSALLIETSRSGETKSQLYECRCDAMLLELTHPRHRRAGLVVVEKDGHRAEQHIACCEGCPFRVDQKTPKLSKRAKSYGSSTARWIAAGRPVRSDEEVDRIAAICGECPFFADGTCTKCGCKVCGTKGEQTLVGITFGAGMVNKIRRATEACPVGKW